MWASCCTTCPPPPPRPTTPTTARSIAAWLRSPRKDCLENRWLFTALSSENRDGEADDGDRPRFDRGVGAGQPHPGSALHVVQQDDAVRVADADAPQAGHHLGDLLGVHAAQHWPAR